MKNYTITVNGYVYDVTVEEAGRGVTPAPVRMAAPASAAAPAPAAPAPAAAAPAPATPTPAVVPAPAAIGAGNVRVEAPVAGKIFKVEAKVGDSVKRGDTIVVIEAMKMENPIVATEDGTVASIDVTVGESVESGALLATLNN